MSATEEQVVSHPFRYGSMLRRAGKRGVSWQVRLREAPGGTRWRTCTRHSYAAACAVLAAWNAEYEARFPADHPAPARIVAKPSRATTN